MDALNSLLPAFNIISLIVFISLASLATTKMASRFVRLVRARMGVPVLLKRDIALLGAFAIYFGSSLGALLLGVTGLGQEWWWVMPRGIMVLSAMAYWTWIEYHLEDGE